MPMIECHSSRFFVLARRGAALATIACGFALGVSAQQTVSSQPAPLLASVSSRPMDLAALAGVNYRSSSSVDDSTGLTDPATAGELFANAGAGLQPPPRRYGRPRYNDSSHNSDGSNKYTFEGAVGFELPIGDTFHYYNTSYAFQAGFGRQWSKKFAVLLQFDYDKFGINGATLNNQLNLYDYDCSVAAGNCLPSLDGNNHVWSFTLNPTYTFMQGDKYGAYVVAGAGFYHKVTNFTTPETGEECSIYYGCFDVTENEVIDHYSSNAPGFNGGLGLTYKFSRFADERFFIEARYVVVLNSQRYGFEYVGNSYVATGTNSDPNNFFPQNSNRTTYIPIKIGIRF